MRGKDPLARPEELVQRVYAYVAYRLGDGPEAEDVTSAAFERALRYRDTYDASRGPPVAWLIGIARRCIADETRARPTPPPDPPARQDIEEDVLRRLAVQDALSHLDERERELVALRFGSDLTARQIGEILGLRPNAVDVALHRAIAKLRTLLVEDGERPRRRSLPASEVSS